MHVSSAPPDASDALKMKDAMQWAHRLTHQALIDLEHSIQDVGALRVFADIILEKAHG